MSNRESVIYNLFTNQAANATSTKSAFARDFRHTGITIATSNTAFTGTIKVKGSRVEKGEDVDFTSASTQSNPWSYVQITRNDTGSNIDGDVGIALAASSDEIVDVAINEDGFNWLTVELSGYSAGDVNVDIILYNNQ